MMTGGVDALPHKPAKQARSPHGTKASSDSVRCRLARSRQWPALNRAGRKACAECVSATPPAGTSSSACPTGTSFGRRRARQNPVLLRSPRSPSDSRRPVRNPPPSTKVVAQVRSSRPEWENRTIHLPENRTDPFVANILPDRCLQGSVQSI